MLNHSSEPPGLALLPPPASPFVRRAAKTLPTPAPAAVAQLPQASTSAAPGLCPSAVHHLALFGAVPKKRRGDIGAGRPGASACLPGSSGRLQVLHGESQVAREGGGGGGVCTLHGVPCCRLSFAPLLPRPVLLAMQRCPLPLPLVDMLSRTPCPRSSSGPRSGRARSQQRPRAPPLRLAADFSAPGGQWTPTWSRSLCLLRCSVGAARRGRFGRAGARRRGAAGGALRADVVGAPREVGSWRRRRRRSRLAERCACRCVRKSARERENL